MTYLKVLKSCNLKPTTEQTADILKSPYARLLEPYQAGLEAVLLHHSVIDQHHYVIFEEAPGVSNRGFLWPGSVEIGNDLGVVAAVASSGTFEPVYPAWEFDAGLASRVTRYCVDKGYRLAHGEQESNIIYIEGVDIYGRENADKFNEWNDLSLILRFRDNKPYLAFKAVCTTEPGDKYTYSPMNKAGAFRIAFGQYTAAWKAGIHGWGGWAHEALVQVGSVTGHRDLNKDGSRTGDKVDTGYDFAINQHGPSTVGVVGGSSAGCLVRQYMNDHNRFMNLLTGGRDGDPRYWRDHGYAWDTVVIDGGDFHRSKWGYGA